MDLTTLNSNITLLNLYNSSISSCHKEEPIVTVIDDVKVDIVGNILDFDYLYSIELKRNLVKKELADYYGFNSSFEELDFISSNSNLLQVLPSIGEYIKCNLDNKAQLSLELFEENKDWKTLFINISTSAPWENIDDFINHFFDTLFELYPDVADKINVNVTPNEF